ncbi:unnamed protein product, partial [Didymodactylos carnosus]
MNICQICTEQSSTILSHCTFCSKTFCVECNSQHETLLREYIQMLKEEINILLNEVSFDWGSPDLFQISNNTIKKKSTTSQHCELRVIDLKMSVVELDMWAHEAHKKLLMADDCFVRLTLALMIEINIKTWQEKQRQDISLKIHSIQNNNSNFNELHKIENDLSNFKTIIKRFNQLRSFIQTLFMTNNNENNIDNVIEISNTSDLSNNHETLDTSANVVNLQMETVQKLDNNRRHTLHKFFRSTPFLHLSDVHIPQMSFLNKYHRKSASSSTESNSNDDYKDSTGFLLKNQIKKIGQHINRQDTIDESSQMPNLNNYGKKYSRNVSNDGLNIIQTSISQKYLETRLILDQLKTSSKHIITTATSCTPSMLFIDNNFYYFDKTSKDLCINSINDNYIGTMKYQIILSESITKMDYCSNRKTIYFLTDNSKLCYITLNNLKRIDNQQIDITSELTLKTLNINDFNDQTTLTSFCCSSTHIYLLQRCPSQNWILKMTYNGDILSKHSNNSFVSSNYNVQIYRISDLSCALKADNQLAFVGYYRPSVQNLLSTKNKEHKIENQHHTSLITFQIDFNSKYSIFTRKWCIMFQNRTRFDLTQGLHSPKIE